ncbi:MAG: membrane protein insertase YidC [Steroidobacteraceae bacterium]
MTSSYPRFLLWCVLGMALWINYQTWVHDYGPVPGTGSPSETARSAGSPGGSAPGLGFSVPRASGGAGEAAGEGTRQGAVSASTPAAGAAPAVPEGPTIGVHTDVLSVRISLEGGTLVQADLLKYPLVKGKPEPVQLENRASPSTLYVLQSGLTGPGSEPRPTHLASFTSAGTDYGLADGSDELRVPLTWTDGHGVTVTKTFVFHRGKYQIGLQQTVDNRGDTPWQAAPYAQILRYDVPIHTSYFSDPSERYSFRGPALYDGTKYRTLKVSSADNQHLALDVTDGWLAAPQHDFVSAVVPPSGEPYRYTLNVDGDEFALATAGPEQTVSPGATASFDFRLFVGPTLNSQLAATAPHFDLVANYGKFTFLAKPLFWLLEQVHGLLHNWGLAIIVVTFLLKLALYPLSEASFRTTAKMRLLGPRIKALQETYKDDKEKSTRAVLDLYKREKANPAAGCLPMLVQVPIFFAYYYVLLGSVEMRQAPFFGWIQDLSSRDPYFILPALMAAASFVQFKISPTTADPKQQKMMMLMPIPMSALFAFFPAGLVLYYLTNSVLSIAQQWNINRRVEAAAARKKQS